MRLVFSIDVDDSGNLTLTERQQWLDDSGYAAVKQGLGAHVQRSLARQPAYKQR